MHRRALLAAALATPFAGRAAAQTGSRTRWSITTSEGFDAIAVMGPLSGKPLYAPRYVDEVAAFGPRLSADAKAALSRLQAKADASGQLLWPSLAAVLSYGPTDTIPDLLRALADVDGQVLPGFRASLQWDQDSWDLLLAGRADLIAWFEGLRAADFAGYRAGLVGARSTARAPELAAALAKYDVIGEQERLTGRKLDPTIGVVLLWFSKPHAASVGGQRSLSHFDYPPETVVRIAAHEMLHPPFPMDGAAAKAALAVLEKDPLLQRVLKEHDPGFGYNSMEGILNEDAVQAIDQMVSEKLGVARDPAERWATADDGMHVLAAALYGMLKAEGYDRTGGNLEAWMADAAGGGKLSPRRVATFAGQVTKTAPERLWPRKP